MQIIESGSSLGTFQLCPRKYRYAYVDRLQSTNYSSPLGFGTFVHAFIEDWKQGVGEGGAFDAAVLREQERSGEVEQVTHDHLLASDMGREWAKYWDADTTHLGNAQLEWSSTEAEWKYRTENGTFIGKRDGVAFHKGFGKHYLHEIKTSGEVNRDTYILRLQMDRQISTNIRALQLEGIGCTGVVYDIIWKPKLIRGVNRKTKPDETLEEFRARIIADVQARPEHYFTRVMVQRSVKDMDEAHEDLRGAFEMMKTGVGEGYPRNTQACTSFGNLCPFFSTCMDSLPIEELGLSRRELKFPELSAEFQFRLGLSPERLTATEVKARGRTVEGEPIQNAIAECLRPAFEALDKYAATARHLKGLE